MNIKFKSSILGVKVKAEGSIEVSGKKIVKAIRKNALIIVAMVKIVEMLATFLGRS